MEFPQSERNQVRRIPARGHYDKTTIYEIIDRAFLCHVSFVVDGQPFVIPTLYGRKEDAVYLHGSTASRMLRNLAQGIAMCLSVTHVDGLVLARSAFHHSINYRSAVLFGTATEVVGPEKEQGLFTISENVLKGRWQEVRPPNERELSATTVLRMDIESASAKIRTGPPKDEEADYDLPVWAGVLPVKQAVGMPQADERMTGDLTIPSSVLRFLRSDGAESTA